MIPLLGAAFVAVALACGYWLGTAHADARWVERSTAKGGLLKECGGAQYYVASREDPEA